MALDIVVALTFNVVLLSLIITAVVATVYFRKQLNSCSERESDYCYTIQCPADNPKTGPCFGFAIRKQKDSKGSETYYCSNNPSVSVDADGKPVKD